MVASDDGRADKPDLTDNQWAALEIELQEIEKGKWKAEAFDSENGECVNGGVKTGHGAA